MEIQHLMNRGVCCLANHLAHLGQLSPILTNPEPGISVYGNWEGGCM